MKWARKEVEIMKKKRGYIDEYHDACAESALRIYESIADEGHSGFSIGVMMNILTRLVDGKPLSPITEEDEWRSEIGNYDSEVISSQCCRYSSLFKDTHPDGTIIYTDMNRSVGVYINSDVTYTSSLIREIVDELYPITLPYYPSSKRYHVYTEDILTDEKNGDFDTVAVYSLLTPEGDKVDINRFFHYTKGGRIEITKEEYEEMKKNKIRIG